MLATQLLVMGTMLAAGGPREVKAVPESLSDVLPANLAVFVEEAGTDRRLETLTAEELEVLRNPELAPAAFVELLGPLSTTMSATAMTYVDVCGPTGVSTWVVAGPGTVVENGIEVVAGEPFHPGETLQVGSVFNAGETTLVFEDADGNQIEIPPGGVLAITCGRACSTGCTAGNYSCCYEKGGCAWCICVKEGKAATCAAGGPGSNACSLDLGSTYGPEPEDDDPWAK